MNYSHDSDGAAGVVHDIVRSGGAAVAVQGDVSRPEDVVALFTQAQRLGPVTAVINNAAMAAFH